MVTKAKPPPDDGDDAADLAVQESIQRARAVFASGTGKTLDLLREADRSLSERLHAVAQKRGGKSTFTAASAEVYRAQIGVVTKYLEKRLEGHTHEQATKAVRIAVRDTVKVAKVFEAKFSGITKPLSLDSQHQQEEAVKGTAQSLLRRHQSSVARYGQRMVGDFERVLRAGMVEGLTQQQMVSRLVESGKHGRVNARRLHASEPGSFPEPTSYVRRRYWAERIVRTEVANAHAAAALQTMTETRAKDMPDLQKKILATFDARTASDSRAVHGQVRPLEGMFEDGAGRIYLRPPARPHDRETIIPWRPRWKETKSTDPLPASEQAAAKVESQAQAATAAERRERLRQAMAAAKGRLEEKKQATAAAQGVAKAKAQKVQRVKSAKAKKMPTGALLDPDVPIGSDGTRIDIRQLSHSDLNADKFRPGVLEGLRKDKGFAQTGRTTLFADAAKKADSDIIRLQARSHDAKGPLKGEGWFLVDGSHRLQVAREKGLKELPSVVLSAKGEEIYRGPMPIGTWADYRKRVPTPAEQKAQAKSAARAERAAKAKRAK
jgi:hypothetical protein